MKTVTLLSNLIAETGYVPSNLGAWLPSMKGYTVLTPSKLVLTIDEKFGQLLVLFRSGGARNLSSRRFVIR